MYKKEILGEYFHKMLLSVQNLIEYLNRNYLHDDETIAAKIGLDIEIVKKLRKESLS